MKIGFVGCGKLGLMVALTIESKGHEVKGYDPNPAIESFLEEKSIPFHEEHSEELLKDSKMEMVSLKELCEWADMLFIAVQTPHKPLYEGVTRIPDTREDFDYTMLTEAVKAVNDNLVRPTVCVVISTVLPGTIDREVRPLLGENFRLVYEPLFIAMGTVYNDYLNPEFVLVGVDDEKAADELEEFYKTIHNKPLLKTDIKSAEAIKVLYNTFITTKTVLGNLYGELAHKTGANVDDIYKALTLSTDRLLSPKYLKSGMGDGGGCHPRDNIALSWLSEKVGMSYNFFDSLMTAREKHTEWLADLIVEHRGYRPVVILGRAFKPETNIETGSPSVLLGNLLKERDVPFDYDYDYHSTPTLYFVGTQHTKYRDYKFTKGSVVIDPFRYIPDQEGVKIIRIGHG